MPKRKLAPISGQPKIKFVATRKFISITYNLMDIIPVVTKINMFFQKENLDLALVKARVDECLQDLQQLKNGGAYRNLLQEDMLRSDSGQWFFKNHLVTGCPEVNQSMSSFIGQLISNIQNRFPDTGLVSAFRVLGLRPLSLLSEEQLSDWGTDQLEILIGHYGNSKAHTWTTKDENGVTIHHHKMSPAVVDADATRLEWHNLKIVVVENMYPRDDLAALWSLIVKYHKNQFPNLVKLAHLCLSCPLHTAGCERGFSVQNRVLTPLRNRLAIKTQDAILRVTTEGSGDDPYFHAAFLKWKQERNRMLLAKKTLNKSDQIITLTPCE